MDFPVEPQEKGEALLSVETSEIFSRQDQLRAFLRFVCEYEIAGRGNELHEYLIGTEVFRQKDGYSTSENSIVRRKAHTLRHKLLDFYATEGVESAVRIVLPKGSYCPRFVRISSAEPPAELTEDSASQAGAAQDVPHTRFAPFKNYFLAGGIFAACVISAIFGYKFRSPSPAGGVQEIIREAWGPLLASNGNPILCIATNAQLQLFALPAGSTDAHEIPPELGIASWYNQHYRELKGDRLYYYPNYSTPVWGDAAGAISISRVFTEAGINSQVLPERVLDPFVLRDRNIVLLGRPANSPAVALLLEGLFYNMKWFTDIKDMEVYVTDPSTHEPKRLDHKASAVHGLITVIRSKNKEGADIQTVVISGTNSAGTLGAVEFFSSAERLQAFREILAKNGSKAFPHVYQIVISTEATTESAQFLPFKSVMEAYKIIEQ